MQETRFDPCVRKTPWRRDGNPLQCSRRENPRTEEPGGPQSTGLQKVRHDWVTNTLTFLSLMLLGFPGGSVVKNSPANAGDAVDVGLIPGSGRSPGGGNGNRLQYPWLENSMDRGALRDSAHGVAKSRTQLSDWARINAEIKELIPQHQILTSLRK